MMPSVNKSASNTLCGIKPHKLRSVAIRCVHSVYGTTDVARRLTEHASIHRDLFLPLAGR
jgi:hypothetical protein